MFASMKGLSPSGEAICSSGGHSLHMLMKQARKVKQSESELLNCEKSLLFIKNEMFCEININMKTGSEFGCQM